MVAGQNDQMDDQMSKGGKLKGGKMNSRGGSSFLGELIVPGGLLFLNQMSYFFACDHTLIFEGRLGITIFPHQSNPEVVSKTVLNKSAPRHDGGCFRA